MVKESSPFDLIHEKLPPEWLKERAQWFHPIVEVGSSHIVVALLIYVTLELGQPKYISPGRGD